MHILVRGHWAAAASCVLVASAVITGGFFVAAGERSSAAAAATTRSDMTAPTTTPATTTPATTTPATTTPATSPPATPTTTPATTTTTTPATAPIAAATPPEIVVAPAVVDPIEVPDTAATTIAPTTNLSTCRTDLPDEVMTIEMPDISYSCPVYSGGQAVIDAGVATVVAARDWDLASEPGAAGTLWITGHRTSHGGPFAAVPDLADGAIITVSDTSRSASYVIVGRSYVEVHNGLAVDASGQTSAAATLDAVLRPDHNAERAPRLLLQTCDSENFRWMIYADLVA